MDKALSLIRIIILLALGIIAIALLFGKEQAENNADWFLCFVIDKALAAGLLWCARRLYGRWRKTDPWFMAYDKMCDDIIDTKGNP